MTTRRTDSRITSLSQEVSSPVNQTLGRLPPAQRAPAREIVACEVDVIEKLLADGRDGTWAAHTVATVRMLGHEWAARGWPLDPLLAVLGMVAERIAEVLITSEKGEVSDRLGMIAQAGNRFLAELFSGYQELTRPATHKSDPEAAALALFRRREVRPGTEVAQAYGVIACRGASEAPIAFDAFGAWLARQADHGVLSLLCSEGGYVLAPADDLTGALAFARRMREHLPRNVWSGVSWRVREEVPEGRTEAVEVLTSALASRRPPGSYQLGDVLVECAILRQPSVSGLLARLIEPVVRNAVLLETLSSLIGAGGNRSKTATDLVIHRSTVEYRLAQIKRLTGHAPSSSRSLQVLAAALTAYEAARCTLDGLSHWDLKER